MTPRSLATKADKLWVNYSHQQPRSVAAIISPASDDEEQSTVAAVRDSASAAKKRQEDLPSPILAACTLEIVATARAARLQELLGPMHFPQVIT
jgi:hypothetical protein